MAQSITLEDLIALNDEIAALARAGAPLDAGLSSLAPELPGRLKQITRRLAERMAAGASLSDALATSGTDFPPLYRAIVEAGIKAGRLPAALEQTSAAARRVSALQRLILLSLIYPLLLLLLAYGLFVFFIMHIAPTLWRSAPTNHPPVIWRSLTQLGEHAAWWWPIFPAVVLIIFAVWWIRSRRAMAIGSGPAGWLFGWMPSFRRLLAETRAASLADILALLVEQHTPLDQALPLAAETTGSPPLIRAARELSAALAAGELKAPNSKSPGGQDFYRRTGWPPLLYWLIARRGGEAELPETLRRLAAVYRRRAVARADWLRFGLPVIFTIAIGGSATLAYCLLLFVPWIRLLNQIAQP